MKKLISITLICLLAVCTALTVSSCGGKSDDGTTTQKQNSGKSKPTFTINGDEIELSYERNHKDLYYKENLTELHSNTAGSFRNIDYYKDGDNVFDIRIVYFAGKSVDEVMSESDYQMSKKTINGIEYDYFEYTDNDRPGHTYVCAYDGTTYTISFASNYDMKSLEEVFLSQVYFKHTEN